MAGDWIKVEHCTPDKPEVDAMASKLQIDHDAAFGKCMRLWIWADQQSVDGDALSVTNSFIDRIVFCPGFAEALRSVGWLTGRDGRLSIPNFCRHNGNTAKTRALANDRNKNKRKRDAASVTKASPEKRREEKSNTHTLPEAFDDDEFLKTWERWQSHRLEKNKPLGQIEEEAQLMDLARHSVDEAVAMVEFSIRQGAVNLITNGDHKQPPRKQRVSGSPKEKQGRFI